MRLNAGLSLSRAPCEHLPGKLNLCSQTVNLCLWLRCEAVANRPASGTLADPLIRGWILHKLGGLMPCSSEDNEADIGKPDRLSWLRQADLVFQGQLGPAPSNPRSMISIKRSDQQVDGGINSNIHELITNIFPWDPPPFPWPLQALPKAWHLTNLTRIWGKDMQFIAVPLSWLG